MSCKIDNNFRRGIDYRMKDLAHFCNISREGLRNILDSRASPRVFTAIKIVMFFNLYFCDYKKSFRWRVEDFWEFDQEELNNLYENESKRLNSR